MKFWAWRRPAVERARTLEEAGDLLAKDLVETLNWMSSYAPGGVPGWFDQHLEDIHTWWALRR